jgi:hypothetical protein
MNELGATVHVPGLDGNTVPGFRKPMLYPLSYEGGIRSRGEFVQFGTVVGHGHRYWIAEPIAVPTPPSASASFGVRQ